ncbi:sigma factor-like helix-turn-helix DNA-binding protein [Jiangella alkaliphila]|uniref:sigma factor-like helix-turn-helix DNA-binding protein n=1 Tax=Jiangella alkaliphila TaxID=419479 RepID=UPI0006298754|nr:sigma factor-like helix-turn-helix DNA-binding protein [Jiangella alkaliphila]
MAHFVLLDRADAQRAVVSVIADVCIERDVARDEVGMRRRLAYLIFVRCLASRATVASLTAERAESPNPGGRGSARAMMASLGSLAGQQRASIALVRFGGFSYRDVAILLDLPAGEVARLLATGLRELAWAGSASPGGGEQDGRGRD